MQKKQLFAGALVTLSALTVLSGCQQAPVQPQKPAEEVIKEGMAKLTDLTSYSYELAMKADVKDPAGQGGKFDIKLSGDVDIKDHKDPKFTFKLDGSGSDESGTGGNGSLDLRLNKEAVYFNVAKLSMTGGEAMPKEVTDMFGKWWKITLPAGVLDEVTASIPQGSQETLTPEQQQMKKAFEESNILSKPSFVGMEDVMGESSYHYSVTLDKKNLVAFMKKAAELQGTPVSETELADAEKGLEKLIDMKVNVWVGSTSMVLNKATFEVKMTGSAEEASGTISVSAMLGNINKPVTLDAPKDATEFPVEQFLGPLMMGGAMGGGLDAGSMDAGMMVPDSSMDTSKALDMTVDDAPPASADDLM